MSSTFERPCPLCGHEESKTLLAMRHPDEPVGILEALALDPEITFDIVECLHCKFMYSKRLFYPPAYLARYENATNKDHVFVSMRSFETYRTALNTWTAVFSFITESHSPNDSPLFKVLDYGCGLGQHAKLIDHMLIRAYGYEINDWQRNYARESGVNIVSEPSDEAPYNLIYLTEVLEHLPEPRQAADLFHSLLIDGGYIWVTVPINYQGLKDDVTAHTAGKSIRKSVNPWEHLNYFTKESLRRVFYERGFELVLKKAETHLLFRKSAA